MDYVEALRTAIRNNDPHGLNIEKPLHTHDFDYAIWRFLHAWCSSPPPTGADLAVLLRQVARWGEGNLLIGRLPEWLISYTNKASVFVSPSGYLQAIPFAPSWIKEDRLIEEAGIDGKPELRRFEERITGEPYLTSLKYKHWNSLAQKEAAWMTLTAPPHSTTLIALPTGSGKSLCFQLLARFGSGLTVVVVPTVALAMDQWHTAKKVMEDMAALNPLYYAASDLDISSETVLESVKLGTTRLIFTSPEACVSGRLKGVIEEAARQGRLENLVIDEAHIIESWGMYFRVDFQMLSMLQRKWMDFEDSNLRTYLLSATFSPKCREVLQELYGSKGQWREFISQRLRPEIAYYQRRFAGENERLEALCDCAWNLPRPAIFYTTEVEEAREMAKHLRESLGFSRVGCFHGETPTHERRRLLQKWRDDELDIMVATSAFGLGVDKSDVRSVVHACFPENLHRFYQEVGRSGRDGASSISILMPCERDIEVAEGISPKLLREETIQKRWEALFQGSESLPDEDYVYKLPTGARHMGLLGARTWGENIRWNKRLILQLKRAGLIDLLNIEYTPSEENDDDPQEWITVRLHFSPLSREVGARVEPQRKAELAEISSGLQQMHACLSAERCTGRLFRELYGSDTIKVCGGCRFCRQNGRLPDPCPDLQVEPLAPSTPSLKIVAGAPNPFRSDEEKARFLKLIRRCLGDKSIRRFACSYEKLSRLPQLFDEATAAGIIPPYRLDALDAGHPLRVYSDETIVFLHIGSLAREGFEFRGGREVVHLICQGLYYLDTYGRFPLESEGARLEPAYEYWMQEA
jgi:ATP-dependent DNA helicase RecQ